MHVDCESYDLSPAQEEGGIGRRVHIADLSPFKLLDAAATCDAKHREVTLTVVNRDKDREQAATIQFTSGQAPTSMRVAEVNGPGPEATNSFEHPDTVGVREHEVKVRGSRFDYSFPAHSITLLRFGFA